MEKVSGEVVFDEDIVASIDGVTRIGGMDTSEG